MHQGECFFGGGAPKSIKSLAYWSKCSEEQPETRVRATRGKAERAARFAQPGANPALMDDTEKMEPLFSPTRCNGLHVKKGL